MRVEMTGARRGFLKNFEIGGVTAPWSGRYRQAGERFGREDRRRQDTFLGRESGVIAREYVAEHDSASLHFSREDVVILELGLHLPEHRLELRHLPQLSRGELLEHADSGGFVALGEHHVEAEHGDLVLVEELVEKERHAVPRPGPPAFAALLPLG